MSDKVELKNFLKTIVSTFGKDMQFRVKLKDGKVFKSKGWDKNVKILEEKNGRTKNNYKR